MMFCSSITKTVIFRPTFSLMKFSMRYNDRKHETDSDRLMCVKPRAFHTALACRWYRFRSVVTHLVFIGVEESETLHYTQHVASCLVSSGTLYALVIKFVLWDSSLLLSRMLTDMIKLILDGAHFLKWCLSNRSLSRASIVICRASVVQLLYSRFILFLRISQQRVSHTHVPTTIRCISV